MSLAPVRPGWRRTLRLCHRICLQRGEHPGRRGRDWAEVQERTRLAPDEILPRAFPVVAAAADAGDVTARAILSDAASKLSALAVTLVERLGLGDNAFILAKAGGTVGRSTFFDAQIDQRLRQLASGVRIEVLSIAPAETAARLALKLVSSAEVAGN